ncbi:MAG: kynureninase [Bacteroidota bacterium]
MTLITATFDTHLSFAQAADQNDPLRHYREHFYFPQHDGREVLYFCGNSLGLQPKAVKAALGKELDHWQAHAVEGHFRGDMPWMYYHRYLLPQLAHVVGAKEEEVIVMNTLTTNLHLMMVSFYQPTPTRYKIIMEAGAFPSDQYAMETQAQFHHLDPAEAIIEVSPREGEETLRTEDILQVIEEHGAQTALVMFSGVQYYTGQFFDLQAITAAAHRVGAIAGFDLAHAAGNVPMELHDWGVDFAVWCSYKYLNAGPGGPSGVFVHERHGDKHELKRFAGWWGHDEERRFLMEKGFVPMKGAAGWQLSNAQIFSFAAHKVGLDLFQEVGMKKLREKSLQLTAYLEAWIKQLNTEGYPIQIITPSDPAQRGCQLSLWLDEGGRALFDYLMANGVISDWREPGSIRMAPVPMYNSFEDIYRFANIVRSFTL